MHRTAREKINKEVYYSCGWIATSSCTTIGNWWSFASCVSRSDGKMYNMSGRSLRAAWNTGRPASKRRKHPNYVGKTKTHFEMQHAPWFATRENKRLAPGEVIKQCRSDFDNCMKHFLLLLARSLHPCSLLPLLPNHCVQVTEQLNPSSSAGYISHRSTMQLASVHCAPVQRSERLFAHACKNKICATMPLHAAKH
jgi:hypothetical protein